MEHVDLTMRDATFLCWSRCGSSLAVGTVHGELLLLDRATKRLSVAAARHKKRLTCGDWNSAGQFAFASDDRQISIVATAVAPAATAAAAAAAAHGVSEPNVLDEDALLLQQLQLSQSAAAGKTFGQVKVKSRPTNVKFGGGGGGGAGGDLSPDHSSFFSSSASAAVPATPRDAIVSVSMERKTILLYNLDDPENALELAFQARYGAIASFKWFSGYGGAGASTSSAAVSTAGGFPSTPRCILVGFSGGFLVVISTLLSEIGREQFCARVQNTLRDVAYERTHHRVAVLGCGDGTAGNGASAANNIVGPAAGSSFPASGSTSPTAPSLKLIDMHEWSELLHQELDFTPFPVAANHSPVTAAVTGTESSETAALASASAPTRSNGFGSSTLHTVSPHAAVFASASAAVAASATASRDVSVNALDKVQWSPDGAFLAVSTRAGHLLVYSVAPGAAGALSAPGAGAASAAAATTAQASSSRAGGVAAWLGAATGVAGTAASLLGIGSSGGGRRAGGNLLLSTSGSATDATSLRLAKRRQWEAEMAGPHASVLQRIVFTPFTLLSTLACASAAGASAVLALSAVSGVSLGEMWRMTGCSNF